MVARRAHNPKVIGSNPVPASKREKPQSERAAAFSFWARRDPARPFLSRTVRRSNRSLQHEFFIHEPSWQEPLEAEREWNRGPRGRARQARHEGTQVPPRAHHADEPFGPEHVPNPRRGLGVSPSTSTRSPSPHGRVSEKRHRGVVGEMHEALTAQGRRELFDLGH